MKNLFFNTRIMMIAMVTFLTTGLAFSSFANDKIKGKLKKDPNPVELKFRGIVGERPVFDLVFISEEENEFTVTVRDENKVLLYKTNVRGGNFFKRYTLDTEELGKSSVQFEISNRKTGETVVFKVDREITVVDNLAINRVK
jgi:hypothetical protein